MEIRLRHALPGDTGAIAALIAASARGLGSSLYTPEQIEAALQSAFGVDSQLIEDRTYFLAMDGRTIAGCGGWSYRETLFGGDAEKGRSAAPVNPESGAAKIRAFFTRPEYARLGVGSAILRACEAEAWRHGYRKLELMATLPGIAFYQKHGFVAGPKVQHVLGEQITIEFVPMAKRLGQPAPHEGLSGPVP